MKLLWRGAEADIYLTAHDGREAILKVRKARKYVNARLDARIRRARTIREAQMLSAIKALGVAAPLVFDVDVGRHSILMRRIRGTIVGTMRASRLASACAEIGRIAATLHKSGIVHGDMTTSNFISSRSGIAVVDLGLSSRSQRDEDCAVDLRLFKQVLGSVHAVDAEPSWKAFVAAYGRVIGRKRLARVLRLVEEIEQRGRYATVT